MSDREGSENSSSFPPPPREKKRRSHKSSSPSRRSPKSLPSQNGKDSKLPITKSKKVDGADLPQSVTIDLAGSRTAMRDIQVRFFPLAHSLLFVIFFFLEIVHIF